MPTSTLWPHIVEHSSLAKAMAVIYDSIATSKIAHVNLSGSFDTSFQIPQAVSTPYVKTPAEPQPPGLWLTTANVVAGVPPMVTAVAPVKPVPVIVIAVPPVTGPPGGVTEVTVGAAMYVNFDAAEVAKYPATDVVLERIGDAARTNIAAWLDPGAHHDPVHATTP